MVRFVTPDLISFITGCVATYPVRLTCASLNIAVLQWRESVAAAARLSRGLPRRRRRAAS
jgi:hypothetical protein